MRASAMLVQLIPRRVKRARPTPAPEQKDVLVRSVVETVDVAGLGEDHVIRARGLFARIGVDRSVSADDEEKLVTVGMTVRLMPRARRQDGSSERQPVRARLL